VKDTESALEEELNKAGAMGYHVDRFKIISNPQGSVSFYVIMMREKGN
jgi:hypothetical protein